MKLLQKIGIASLCLFFTKNVFSQQLRLGENPYAMEKSAVLELVSENQGLLFPRITDTSLINVMNPPDGMVIYFTPTKRLLLRTNGSWHDLAVSSSVVSSLNGNTGALTMDTSYISNFYSKVRSLFSATAPITYSNGSIGITQAGSSSNGYLSSTDWNTFNNKQPAGNYLSDPGGNGLLARTALNTIINRTITGTANRIDINNGSGVSGDPIIDISSFYAGQTSITTLGTITTGTWNGSILSGTYGGTGVNNGTKTITLGNNFITSGNYALTLTQTGATNVTLPTSGTLATLNGIETFTNKTLTSATNVLGGVTMSLGGDATGDMYYRNSSGVLTRFPIGSTGYFLKVVAGNLAWDPSSSANHNLLSSTHGDATIASVVRGDIITGQGATPTWSRLAIGSQGQILQAGANEVGYTSFKLPTSVGIAGQQLRANGTDYVNKTTTTYQATPADPSTTSSSTGVMMGLAGSITPAYSGVIMIIISGDMGNNTNNTGVQSQIRYGTGSAPANGAALTGTTAGSLVKMTVNNANNSMPFSLNAIVSGLTVGTTYWIDISLATISGGTVRTKDLSISVIEL